MDTACVDLSPTAASSELILSPALRTHMIVSGLGLGHHPTEGLANSCGTQIRPTPLGQKT